jgi:hypothetical protein
MSFVSSPNKSKTQLKIYFWQAVNLLSEDFTTKHTAFISFNLCKKKSVIFIVIFSSSSIPTVSPNPGQLFDIIFLLVS